MTKEEYNQFMELSKKLYKITKDIMETVSPDYTLQSLEFYNDGEIYAQLMKCDRHQDYEKDIKIEPEMILNKTKFIEQFKEERQRKKQEAKEKARIEEINRIQEEEKIEYQKYLKLKDKFDPGPFK